MRKTITGTGGMLLIQTLKDAGVEYLFTNPGSAETGIFAALLEDGDQKLVVGKHEGLVAAMADGYHRISGKVGVVIAHVMGGSYQLAGQLFNAQVAGSSLLVIAGDWASELQDYRGLAPFPGLTQAESMRPITKDARCAYTVQTNPKANSQATIRALREATTPPTGPVYLSISAELLNRDGLEAQIGEDAHYVIERPGPARPQTVEAIARRLAEARCPVLMFGDDVWREGAQAEAVALAETLEAPVFNTRQIFVNFPSRHPLFCGMYPVSKDFEKVTGLKPDLIFLVGCQGVHGAVAEPTVMQIGPNPLLMGRHYPLDVAAQCDVRGTLRDLVEALPRLHGADRTAAWGRERPVVLHLGDGALGYSAAGFWTMARYNTAVLTVDSNNESYQVVRHNWYKDMPDTKMFRENKYPGLWLSAPAVDYVGLARSQGVDGESVKTVQDLEPALRRGMERITRENRPYVVEVSVAREGIGAESTWYQDWQL